MPEKYNKQLMDVINNSGLNKFPTAGTTVPLPVAYKPPPRTQKDSAAAATQTTDEQTTVQQQQQQPRLPITDLPMTTAPTHQHQRPSLPSPKRTVPDEVAEGFVVKTDETTGSTNRSDKTRINSRTSNNQTTNYSNHSQNKQGTRDYSMLKRRHQRTHHRDDLT